MAIVGGPRAQFTDLSGTNTTFPTVRYVQTLETRLTEAGIAHMYAESGEVFDLDGVRRTVREAFDALPDMDAFVGADLAAAFAVQEATMRGIAVPGDLQIVAYDGTMAADCAGFCVDCARHRRQNRIGDHPVRGRCVPDGVTGSGPGNHPSRA